MELHLKKKNNNILKTYKVQAVDFKSILMSH